MPMIPCPLLNVLQRRSAIASDFQNLPYLEALDFAFGQNRRHRAHLAFGVKLLHFIAHLEHYDFVAGGGPLNQIVKSYDFNSVY